MAIHWTTDGLCQLLIAAAQRWTRAINQTNSTTRFRLNARQINHTIVLRSAAPPASRQQRIPLPAATILRSVSGWLRGNGYLHPPASKTETHRLIAQAVAIFQHQQLFTGQIGHRYAIAVRPRVIFIDRQHHRLIKQRHFDKGFTLFDQRQNRAVEFAAV